MQNPKIIIELNTTITKKERENIKKGLLSLLSITEKEIEIFNAKEYTFSSEFSQKVYEEIRHELSYNYVNFKD